MPPPGKIFLALLLCYCGTVASLPATNNGNGDYNVRTFTVLHLNDLHAHFEQVNVYTGVCKPDMAAKKECYGGSPRIMTMTKEVRAKEGADKVMLLNAGDFYTGTIWYTLFRWRPVLEFALPLNYTAACPGNHEFDHGIEGFTPFSNNANFPFVAANMVQVPQQGVPAINYTKSTIVEIQGVRVGIVGYITTTTAVISKPGPDILFFPVVQAVRKEARRLRYNISDPVDIVIGLGHNGYDNDVAMAKVVPELDLVVGGHSHTFLYTGTPPSVEKPQGPYPTYVKSKGGKIIPVVQAYCFSKYMGRLKVNVDKKGKRLVVPVEGAGISEAEVILLDHTVKQDEETLKMMEPYEKLLAPYYATVGWTDVNLHRTYQTESNIGDVVAQSMLDAWPDGDVAANNEAGIRGDILKGSITGEDIYNVLPFNNTVDKLVMKGSSIKHLLESYASGLCPNQTCHALEFLQIAGMRVTYDIRNGNEGHRVTKLLVRCPKDEANKKPAGCEDDGDEGFCPMDMDKEYNYITNGYLAEGKATYLTPEEFSSLVVEHVIGGTDFDALRDYVKANSPIRQRTDGRIKINYHTE